MTIDLEYILPEHVKITGQRRIIEAAVYSRLDISNPVVRYKIAVSAPNRVDDFRDHFDSDYSATNKLCAAVRKVDFVAGETRCRIENYATEIGQEIRVFELLSEVLPEVTLHSVGLDDKFRTALRGVEDVVERIGEDLGFLVEMCHMKSA